MKNRFRIVANRVSTWAGSAYVFVGAVAIVLMWVLSGPIFNYSDTWQLVINTATTIVTFLMVFLIQNTQNRDGKALQIKLDELLRATKGARMYYVNLEELTDFEIDQLNKEFQEIAHRPHAAKAIQRLHEKIEAEHAERHGFGLNRR
ncbi:low affinity iron permease family protein [Candidatus Saccharibacteria bacterium]|nr:low affinity iron permease family protein [Candidatus Saccharibacteria bacterium]